MTSLPPGRSWGCRPRHSRGNRDRLAERWDDYGRPTPLTIVQGALISARRHRADRTSAPGRPPSGRGHGRCRGSRRAAESQPPAMAQRRSPGEAPKRCQFAACTHRRGTAPVGPAFSVPMGFDPDGLPLGLQIIGRPFADDLVLAIGHAYQHLTDWHLRRPPHHA